MRRTETIIIGGGQAGLAISRCLSDCRIAHVVLERGRVAERWRTERWDSLRLLTPNWLSRLPGYHYAGAEPDGFMTMPEVIGYLDRFAESFSAPVETGTNVTAVRRAHGGFHVETNRGKWAAPVVVIATGYCDLPLVPDMHRRLPGDILQLVPSSYRNPGLLPEGGVLVVGAGASGIQLADEIRASGRPVTLAVGRHIRLPRRYRGRDILWWLNQMGLFDQGAEEVSDLEISRNQPSWQLVGRPDHASLDLPILQQCGVRLAGRLTAIDGATVSFDDGLLAMTAATDYKLAGLLRRIDEFATRAGFDGEIDDAPPFVPSWTAIGPAPASLDLRAEGITTVVWATGFRRDYPWLKIPVLDARGEIRHHHGVTDVPGLFVIGMPFLRRRSSAFIDGVGSDARELAGEIADLLERSRAGALPGIGPGSRRAPPPGADRYIVQALP